VPLERRFGIVSAAIELRQRQWEFPDQFVIGSELAGHGCAIEDQDQGSSPKCSIDITVRADP
jgi:hypothetical protein